MPETPRGALITRLIAASQDVQRKLRVLSESLERILVEVAGKTYLIMLQGAGSKVTPGSVTRRIKYWQRLKGRKIQGHLLLAEHADLSANVISADGKNLPPSVAVVGRWGRSNRLVASGIDSGMAYLLELAGVAGPDIRRLRRKETTKSSGRPIPPAPAHVANDPADGPASVTQRSTPNATWNRSLRSGMRLDAYELDRRLGRGYSAEVWKARLLDHIDGIELAPGAVVAIKVYSSSLLQGFQPLRIQREFSVAASLVHGNLARVYDLVLSPSRPFHTFMVMEYVDGPTLKSFIEQRRSLELWQVLTIGEQLFSALVELHSMGDVHRDVKAANIMIAQHSSTALDIKLVDLGIVSVATDDKFTAASMFLGSKHSAPLEQLTGGEVDERTDIYGAGSVLYHCLRGVPLYQGAGPEGAIVRKMLSAPERMPLDSSAPGSVEQQLAEFVNHCLAVEPRDRPLSALECFRALQKMKANVRA